MGIIPITSTSGFGDPVNNGGTVGTSTFNEQNADEMTIGIISNVAITYTLTLSRAESLTKMTGLGVTNTSVDAWRARASAPAGGAPNAATLTLNGGGPAQIIVIVSTYRYAGDPMINRNTLTNFSTSATPSLPWGASAKNSFMIIILGNTGFSNQASSNSATVDVVATDADAINAAIGHQLSLGGSLTETLSIATAGWVCAGYELPAPAIPAARFFAHA